MKNKPILEISNIFNTKFVWFIIFTFYLIFFYRTFFLKIYPSPPFFYDEGDSLADWYNACAWSFRYDRYTTWQSLYTPFAHLICVISRNFYGTIELDWYKGWRQFSNASFLITFYHILFWLSIFIPIKKIEASKFIDKLRIYFKERFLFKLIVFFSFAALYSFERGNLLSLCFLCYILSLKFCYYNKLKFISPILIGISAAIKPYILFFKIYTFKTKDFWKSILVIIILTIISIVLIGAPGINFLGDNLEYFSNFNSVGDILNKSISIFSYKGYDIIYEKLIDYGFGGTEISFNFKFGIAFLKILSFILFSLSLIFCFRLVIKLNRLSKIENNLFTSTQENLLKHIIPLLILTYYYSSQSISSGAYTILFFLGPLLWLEEETNFITKRALLFFLFILCICMFDMFSLGIKSYSCGSANSFRLYGFDYTPLITQITGILFKCTGKQIGFFSLIRPLAFNLFGLLLFFRLNRITFLNLKSLKVKNINR